MDTNLQELNVKMAEAEDNKASQFFTGLLSANLLFRRANGEVVGKQKFLSDLQDPNRPKLKRRAEEIQITQLSEVENHALVKLIVCTIDEKWVEKRYRNIRLFTCVESGWVLEFWYNYELTSL